MTASSVDTDRPLNSPVSPSTALSSSVDEEENEHPNALDDVFGSSPPQSAADSLRSHIPDSTPSHAEPSDLPSLRRQHVTAGYRDGIAVAKGEHVQRGFDSGFPVGAELGIRVGVVLGVLEGLMKTLSRGDLTPGSHKHHEQTASSPEQTSHKDETTSETTSETTRVTALYETAKRELAVEKVFRDAAQGEEDPCVRLGKVGDSVVAQWEDRVRMLLAELKAKPINILSGVRSTSSAVGVGVADADQPSNFATLRFDQPPPKGEVERASSQALQSSLQSLYSLFDRHSTVSTVSTSVFPTVSPRASHLDETNDVYGQSTIPSFPRQRQRRHQRRAALRDPAIRPAQQLPRQDFASIDQTLQQQQQQEETRLGQQQDQQETRLGQQQEQEQTRLGQGRTASYWPAHSTRVSSRTTSAILWVLEEAIRTPFPFTEDLSELNAPMSELFAGDVAVGNGRGHHNGVPRTGQPLAVPASTHPASGVRTPTDIMRRRREREAQLKAEQEAKMREEQLQKQAQAEAQAQAQAQAEHAQAAGVEPSRRPGVHPPDITISQEPGPRHDQTNINMGRRQTTQPPGNTTTTTTAGTRRQGGQLEDHEKPARQRSNGSRPAVTGTAQQQESASKPQAGQPGAAQQSSRSKAAFPHAFERWEMLSSHWEGLTSYWIRRLEQNNEELSKDPLSQQMSRQVTDLSAAGANLFHAVVELQRLRASSERKFQRWFFDTRAEQERSQEVRAELERMLSAERQSRADAVAALKQSESDKAKAQELAREVRRELQISRDEARRAWEELGRREQEERDRTISLRNGEPTIVGGVQVVPMLQAIPSRHASSAARPQTREGPYPGGPSGTSMGGQSQRPLLDTTESTGYDSHETDPFVESRDPPFAPDAPPPRQTEAPVQSPGRGQTEADRGHFYQHDSQTIHGGQAHAGVDVDVSDVISETDHIPTTAAGAAAAAAAAASRQDTQGRQLVYPRAISDDSDDYNTEPFDGYVSYGSEQHTPAGAGTSAEEGDHAGYPAPVDYSGSGWGVGGSGWDSVTPRHRHPTRLSDVLEEDERSRTSPSRASQASRTMQ
ncbi:uncharacterized protein GIQ15_06997 [Arthroderma uncinatum]|uniref:uncharacterized protein n=1 Tax=Arthroderma uncinatum TaxID=74035 RepID=UPI00144A77F4|nr:uncharacterized protein GIQ15_06997 [Arthroderma uncinatum]KAF3480021.1 hypothetical protein GIQ15_06997 [Arthroderma uncinatum]